MSSMNPIIISQSRIPNLRQSDTEDFCKMQKLTLLIRQKREKLNSIKNYNRVSKSPENMTFKQLLDKQLDSKLMHFTRLVTRQKRKEIQK